MYFIGKMEKEMEATVEGLGFFVVPSSWKGSRGSVKSPNIGRSSFRHRLALKGPQGPFAILRSLSPRFHLEHLHS